MGGSKQRQTNADGRVNANEGGQAMVAVAVAVAAAIITAVPPLYFYIFILLSEYEQLLQVTAAAQHVVYYQNFL